MANKNNNNWSLCRQKIKKDVKRSFFFASFLLVFLMIIFCTSVFLIGFHNLDNGQNMRYLECVFGVDLVDLNGKYELIEPEVAYIEGFKDMYLAFFFGMFFSGLFGGFIYKIITKKGFF